MTSAPVAAGGGGTMSQGAWLPAIHSRGWFQVSSNFHNKPGESQTRWISRTLCGTGRIELFNFRNRPDENALLGFAQETMHWEQFLRLTNGKVRRFGARLLWLARAVC